jgi:hypothetical protein
MSSEAAPGQSVLILRVREDRIPQVLEALEGIDLGVADDVGGFMLGSRLTGRVVQTRPTGAIMGNVPHGGTGGTDTAVQDVS